MFMGLSPNEYPDRQVLLKTLLEGVGRLDLQGGLVLTEGEASILRQAGYTSALGAGRWAVA